MNGLNGNEAAQPRVFAHDMVPIAIGAINPRQEGTGAYHNSVSNGLEMTAAGVGYSADDIITLTTGAGATEAAQVKILTVDSPSVETSSDDLATAITTNQTDFVDNNYTGTVGVTAGYSTSGAGTGLIITVTVSGNTVTQVNVDSVGTGFVSGDTITVTGSGGVLGGVTGNLVLTVGTGVITSFELSITGTANKPYGEGYVVGDTLSDAGAGVSTFTVRNIDLPNTEERGCCIFAGILIDTGLDLVLESGELYNTTYTARLKGVTAGSFLPVLAKRVVAVSETAAVYASGDLLAIY